MNNEWIAKNRDRYNASKSKYRLKLKREVMEMYAKPLRCGRCGFDKIDALCLDHIHNNGATQRKEQGISHRGFRGSGVRIYEYIRKNGKIDGLQVLCANCNTMKEIRRGRRKAIKDTELLAEVERLYGNYDS